MRKSHRTLLATLFSLAMLFLSTATAWAGDIPHISTADLKAKMDAGEHLVLADALSPIEHDELSIKGSVNIPAAMVEGNQNLPTDKGTLLIFYCKGPKCGKSLIAAQKAVALGYTNVMIYNEGLPAWAQNKFPLEKNVEYPKVDIARLTPQQVFDMKDSIVILDIRGGKHKELGKIAGATEIVLDKLNSSYSSLPKGKKIVVVDHAAKQVVVTAKFLYMKGYTDVAVMDGGITAWLRAGLPVTK
ncbi:MAG: rhodanese-like domain-containing protein [Proteobacteria bacterium]|nr:rhodanese-like domain-containing protein [Pseudomonadota bacterium]